MAPPHLYWRGAHFVYFVALYRNDGYWFGCDRNVQYLRFESERGSECAWEGIRRLTIVRISPKRDRLYWFVWLAACSKRSLHHQTILSSLTNLSCLHLHDMVDVMGAARSKEWKGVRRALIRVYVWVIATLSWLVYNNAQHTTRLDTGILLIVLPHSGLYSTHTHEHTHVMGIIARNIRLHKPRKPLRGSMTHQPFQ